MWARDKLDVEPWKIPSICVSSSLFEFVALCLHTKGKEIHKQIHHSPTVDWAWPQK